MSSDEKKVPKNPAGWATRWGSEFAYAKSWHRNWLKDGDTAYNAYLNKNTMETDPSYTSYNLNLFSSNINTVQAMLFGQTPVVSVDRRWADPNDEVARIASEGAQRLLNLDLEESGDDYSCVMRSCLQDRLIPGCGIARVKYDYTSHTEKKEAIYRQDAEPKISKGKATYDDDDVLAPAVENEVMDDEWVDEIYVHWKDALWSPCRYWSEMRWLAFRTYMDRTQLCDRFGDKIGKAVPLNAKSPLEEGLNKSASEVWSKAAVWEIWDKEHRHIFWYVEGFERTLDDQDDFLKLDNFFPCPPFLIANVTTIEYLPTSDWKLARSLYREIDNLEERISLLTSAVKVMGVYDKKAEALGRLFNETAENKMIPVDNWAMFAEKGGIKGSIDWYPFDQVVMAIQTLQQQQQARIAQLYQITGMSDVIRGDAGGPQPASATEQAIKAKFASVRLQSIQDEFARFATDLQKLKFEIIAKHFRPETIIAKSNLLNSMDKDNAQAVQQAVALIKNPRVAEWRIVIKPESMAMTDYAQLQATRTEYLKSLGFYMQSIEPFAMKFPSAVPTLIQLLRWGLAGFKGSQEVQGVLDRGIAQMEQAQQTQQQQPPPPNPMVQREQVKQQGESQRSQQEAQQDMAQTAVEHQFSMQEQQQQTVGKIAEIAAQTRADVLKPNGGAPSI